MVTNEERREVARKLREVDMDEFSCYAQEHEVIETILGCWIDCEHEGQETNERLADLIEPEPERTCRNLASLEFSELEGKFYRSGFYAEFYGDEKAEDLGFCFICSECGAAVSDSEGYHSGMVDKDGNYKGFKRCPNCEAKVVSE